MVIKVFCKVITYGNNQEALQIGRLLLLLWCLAFVCRKRCNVSVDLWFRVNWSMCVLLQYSMCLYGFSLHVCALCLKFTHSLWLRSLKQQRGCFSEKLLKLVCLHVTEQTETGVCHLRDTIYLQLSVTTPQVCS